MMEDWEILERDEERRLELAKAHGHPITREDYEKPKREKSE